MVARIGELTTLLETAGLSHLEELLEEEELTAPLLASITNLPAVLAELGITASDACSLEAAVHAPAPPLKARDEIKQRQNEFTPQQLPSHAAISQCTNPLEIQQSPQSLPPDSASRVSAAALLGIPIEELWPRTFQKPLPQSSDLDWVRYNQKEVRERLLRGGRGLIEHRGRCAKNAAKGRSSAKLKRSLIACTPELLWTR